MPKTTTKTKTRATAKSSKTQIATRAPSPKKKMPKFVPAPEALKTRFAEIVARYPEAERRIMFSYPSAFVNGQMFICVFGDGVMLRLNEADRAKFLEMPDTKMFEPMPGRPMKEYVKVPRVMLDSDQELDRWLTKSLAFAAVLPPKIKSKKK